ncbi:MAG: branched-chain amino acid ABC transporter permease [Candidatus Dormibacteraeota bacterium]|nr:branched-chain amino acid ABC transporter permease [Candidatus Dormibacteraeota bacterium]
MGEFMTFLFAGLTVGAINALTGLGLLIVYNVTGVINFAQGDFVMLGAMAAILFAGANGHRAGLPLIVAVVLAVMCVSALGGILERTVLHPRRKSGPVLLLIMTVGISLVLEGVVLVITSSQSYGLRNFTPGPALSVFGGTVSLQSLWVFGVTGAALVALYLFFSRTRVGKAFRACEINPLAASLVGIRPSRYWTYAFALAAGLSALAGAVIAPVTTATYDMGLALTLSGFVAWVLGGLVSPVGVVVGGVGLGVAQGMVNGYLPLGLVAYANAFPFVILIAVLVVRPNGIIRSLAERRV